MIETLFWILLMPIKAIIGDCVIHIGKPRNDKEGEVYGAGTYY